MNIVRPLIDLREDGWDRIVDTDLKGYWLCSQAIGKIMVEQKMGCIINLTSGAAQKAVQGMGAYSIAKAGVVMLTKALALELAGDNLRVNAISPGLVRTKFSEPFWSNPELLKQLLLLFRLVASPKRMILLERLYFWPRMPQATLQGRRSVWMEVPRFNMMKLMSEVKQKLLEETRRV